MATRDSLGIQEEQAEMNRKIALDNFEAFRAYIRLNPNDKSPPTPGELLRAKELASQVWDEQRKFSQVNSPIDEKRRRDAQDMISAGLEDLIVPDTTQQIRSVLEHLLTSLDNKGRLPKDAFEGFDLSARNGTKLAINIRLDADIVSHFKRAAGQTNAKYQTMINTVLRQYIDKQGGRWDAKGERRIIGLIITPPIMVQTDRPEIVSNDAWEVTNHREATEARLQELFMSPLLFNVPGIKAENITRLMVRHSEGRYILFADHFEHYIPHPNPEEVLKGVLTAAGFKVEEFAKQDYLDWSFKRRQAKAVVPPGAVHNHHLVEECITQGLEQVAEALDQVPR